MLSKPRHGWTLVSFGNYELGSASYATDVPMDTMNAFISYLSQDFFNNGFNTSFDAEPYTFSIIEFEGNLYLLDSKTDADVPNITELQPRHIGMAEVETLTNQILYLAKELVQDIESNIDEWTDWLSYDEMTESEKVDRKCALLAKAEVLQRLIQKHETK